MEEGRLGAFCDCDAPGVRGVPAETGWSSLDERLRAVYGDAAPLHYGSTEHVSVGGIDPIEAISAYEVDEPYPHLHLVSFGMSELYGKTFLQNEISGFGFELTMRVRADDAAPAWAMALMQTLAAYVHATSRPFLPGNTLDTNQPLAPDVDTALTGVCFAEDTTLGAVQTKNGYMRFLQVVGITPGELEVMRDWDAHGVLDLFAARDPLLITDLGRAEIMDDAAVAAQLGARMAKEPSTQTGAHIGDARWALCDGEAALTIGALHVQALRRGLLRRVPFGESFALVGGAGPLKLEPALALSFDERAIRLPAAAAKALGDALRAERGVYQTHEAPGLVVQVEPTEIRDDEGRIVRVPNHTKR